MREIKFREYSHQEKQMFGPWTLEQIVSGKYVTSFDGQVMQFTGLKDKNGKEIYEGDILLNTFKNLNQKVVIEWNHGKYEGLNEKYPELEGFQSSWGEWNIKSLDERITLATHHGYFEVIGNIYENPELLK